MVMMTNVLPPTCGVGQDAVRHELLINAGLILRHKVGAAVQKPVVPARTGLRERVQVVVYLGDRAREPAAQRQWTTSAPLVSCTCHSLACTSAL